MDVRAYTTRQPDTDEWVWPIADRDKVAALPAHLVVDDLDGVDHLVAHGLQSKDK